MILQKKIEKIKPWEKLADTELFVYKEDGNIENALYFCTMGNAGIHKSVAVYKGKQIRGYLEILNELTGKTNPYDYQECLKVCYLPEHETIEANMEIINELGIKFDEEYISFEKFEIGYEPSKIDDKEIVFMTKALENYYELYEKYLKENINVNFGKNEVYVRNYNTKTNTYKDEIEIIKYLLSNYLITKQLVRK